MVFPKIDQIEIDEGGHELFVFHGVGELGWSGES